MGNQASSSSSYLGRPSSDLKFRSGPRAEGVPAPMSQHCASYDKLVAHGQFKDYLLSHLDNTHLISSIISNSDKDKVVFEGVTPSLSGDLNSGAAGGANARGDIFASLKLLQNLNRAGVSVQLPELMSLCEKELDVYSEVGGSITTRSLQLRMAALRAVGALMAKERLSPESQWFDMPIARSSVDTASLPHLHYMLPLQQAGYSLLSMISSFLPATTDPQQRAVLLGHLDSFCSSLHSIPSLALFKTWSPATRPPLRAVGLNIDSAKASSGDAKRAVDGSATSFWSCDVGRCDWSVELSEPSSIAAIRISWAPLKSSSSVGCAAPKKMAILIQKAGQTDRFSLACSVDLESERKKQDSWTHVYNVEASDISAIKIVMTGTAQSSLNKKQVHMYSFEALAIDASATSLNCISSLRNLQAALVPLADEPEALPYVLNGLPVLTRASGSLEMLFSLVKFIRAKNFDDAVRASAPESMHLLLRSMQQEIATLEASSDKELYGEQVLTNITFDDVDKSPEVEISEGGMMLGCTSGGNSYGMLNCSMDTGIWEWEITLVRENNGDETTCLGVATRPVSNVNYDSTSDLWLVRCYNGELYHGGRQSRRTIPNIHPSDVCRFTFDASNSTLSLAVNGTDHGILFENVPKGVAPAVLFYGGGKTVRLLNIKRTGGVATTKVKTSVKEVTYEDIYGVPIAEVDASTSKLPSEIDFRPSRLFLEKAATIAQLHCTSFYNILNLDGPETILKKRDLEYPYGIQVHATLFESFIELLDTCDVNKGQDVELIKPTLSLIEAQFACLASTKVDPNQLGLGATKEKSCNKVLSILASKLRALIKCEDEIIRQYASTAFSAGIPYFFPFIAGRIEFGFSKIRDLLSYSSTSISTDASKSIVFSAILRRLARQSEIMEMLQLFKSDAVWRSHILEFIFSLLDVVADYTEFLALGKSPHQDTVGSVLVSSTVLTSDVFTILKRFQEQISYDLISTDSDSSYNYECTLDVMTKYVTRLFTTSANLCHKLVGTSKRSLGSVSFFSEILSPVIHGLAVCVAHIKFVERILNPTVTLLKGLTQLSLALPECQSALQKLSEVVANRNASLSLKVGSSNGWRDVTIPFDESDSSYSILEGGMIYSSTQSSNTCAVIPIKFGGSTRAAWEFLLLQDTNNDECAVFGASMYPITSRCYSSSPNLWMRRAYNGNLYSLGRNVGTPMKKIHPGDTVRVEFDGREGTLSYSVNGEELEVAFNGITEEISPACGSYRSGIRIQLLKVEVFGSALPGDAKAPEVVHWVVDSTLSQADNNMTLFQPNKKLYPGGTTAKEALSAPSWVTARGDHGCTSGVHEWAFEVTESSLATLAFGIVSGGEPFSRDHIGGLCKTPAPVVSTKRNPTDPASISRSSVTTSRGLRYYCGREVEYYEGPSQWCSSRGSCTCDGRCGPSNGCMCEGCYRATFPGEFTAPPSPRSGPPTTSDGITSMQSLVGLIAGLRRSAASAVAETESESKREDTAGEGLGIPAIDPVVTELVRSTADDETLPLLTPPLVRESSAGYARDRSDEPTSEQNMSSPSAVSSENAIKRAIVAHDSSCASSDPYSYSSLGIVGMAWLTDGSLWLNGEKKTDSFGSSFLPLGRYSVVNMRIDCDEGKVSYYVNGAFVGVAFGPEDSDAAVKVGALFSPRSIVGSEAIIYPAASISHCSQGLKIQASGYFGSVVVPQVLYIQKTLASIYGRLASALISGPKLSSSEKLLKPWLQSPLFSGGFVGELSPDEALVKKSLHARVPTGVFNVSVKWIDGVLDRSSVNIPESKVTLKFDLREGESLISSTSTSIVLTGVDVDWSNLNNFELLWTRSSVSNPVCISTEVTIQRPDGKSDVIGLATVDITNELWADRSQGSYFVPVHPKGILTLAVSFIEREVSLSEDATVDVQSIELSDESHSKSLLDDIATVNSQTSNLFIEWLERIEPEPAFLKKAFEASGRYSFPKCERPLVACLLMHGCMTSEAETVIGMLKSNEAGASLPSPSSDMVLLWKRVKQFRQMLRHKKESLKSASATSNTDTIGIADTPISSPSDAPITSISNAAARRDFFLSQGAIQWQVQPDETISSFSSAPRSYYCTVLSFGIDLENEVAYISFNVRGDQSLGDLQHPNVSKLFVDDIEVGSPACFLEIDDVRSNYVGFLRFGLSTFEAMEVKGWKFQFGKSDYSQVDLVAPTFRIGGEYKPPNYDALAASLGSIESKQPNQKKAKTFDEYLDELLFKIKFLRKLSPCGESSSSTESSKMLLVDLMDKYADGNSIAPKLVRWRTEEGQSKWKNMVEFLRVHTKLRRQVSFERGLKSGVDSTVSTGEPEGEVVHSVDELPPVGDMYLGPKSQFSTASLVDDDVGYIQDLSPIDAAMQACTVFITHEFTLEDTKSEAKPKSSPGSSEILEAGIKDRVSRAKLRCMGLKALVDILQLPDINSDPYAVSDLILFLRSSFIADTEALKGSSRRVHYLNNLEGCSPQVLADVQGSFLEVYSTLFQVIHSYLSKWRIRSGINESMSMNLLLADSVESSVSGCETLRAIYLYPIRLLLASWGLHFSGRDHRFLLHSNIIAFLQKVFSMTELERVTKEWAEAANSYMSFLGQCEKTFPLIRSEDSDDVEYQLLSSDAVQEGLVTGSISCREVLLHIYRLPLALFSDSEIVKLKLERKWFKYRCESMNISDVSLFFEEVRSVVVARELLKKELEEKKKEKDKASMTAAESTLGGKLRTGMVPVFDKSAKSKECSIGAGGMVVTSELCDTPRTFNVRCAFADLKYSFRRGYEKTGNYFEVTILEIGEQDIGVGLAVRGEFSVTGNMPGWVEKSYGYHGDDGRKFGSNSTPGSWPKWNKFDVIGCGVDFETRNIFYTRNGELLGDAFLSVAEETLSPVVGFHCPRMVQKVRINFGQYSFSYKGEEIKPHPKAVAFSEYFMTWQSENPGSEASPIFGQVSASTVIAGAVGAVGALIPPIPPVTLPATMEVLIEEEKNEDSINETKEDSPVQDKGFVPKNEAEYRKHVEYLEERINSASDYLANFNILRKQSESLIKLFLVSSCVADSASESPKSDNDIDLPDVLRSPPSLMKAKSVFGTPKFVTAEDGVLLQESITATLVQDILVGSIYLREAMKAQDCRNVVMSCTPADISIVDITSRLDEYVRPSASTIRNGRGVLEICEVESIVFDRLNSIASFSSVVPSLAKDLSRSICLQSFITLLCVGTPRIKSLTLRILIKALPAIDPYVVDALLPGAWPISPLDTGDANDTETLGPSMESPGRSANRSGSKRRAQKSMPNLFIRGLIKFIQRSLSSSNTQTASSSSVGYGSLELEYTDEIINLMQRLFESSLWTEVIAFTLTDVLRDIVTFLKRQNGLNSGLAELQTGETEAIQPEQLEAASAVCVVLSGLGVMFPGAIVQKSDGGQFILISSRLDDGTAIVVNKEQLSTSESDTYLSALNLVENVKIKDLSSLALGSNVVLSELSHPLVQLLSAVLKQGLVWFRTLFGNTINSAELFTNKARLVSNISGEGARSLFKLTSVAANAFNVLLNKQQISFMDLIDADSIENDVLSMALLPTGISVSPRLPDVQDAEKILQSLVIEGVLTKKAKQPDSDDSAAVVAIGGLEQDAQNDEIPSSVPTDEICYFTSINSKVSLSFDEKVEKAKELKAEFNLTSEPFCISLMDYFMYDGSAVRNYIAENLKLVRQLDHEFSEPMEYEYWNKHISDPEMILKQVDNKATTSESEYDVELPVLQRCQLQNTVSSNGTKGSAMSGTVEPFTAGELLSLGDGEGHNPIIGQRFFVCHANHSESSKSELILTSCDHNIGVSMATSAKPSSLRKVVKIFDIDIPSLYEYQVQIDIALIILRMRLIANKLLLEGNVNFMRGRRSLQNWINLMKLNACSGSIPSSGESGQFSLTSLAASYITSSRMFKCIKVQEISGSDDVQNSYISNDSKTERTMEDDVIDYLVDDVSKNFISLLDTSNLADPSVKHGEAANKGSLTSTSANNLNNFQSVHPLVLGHSVVGEFNFPSSWKGAVVAMDSRSAVPEAVGAIKFYSKSDYPSGKPASTRNTMKIGTLSRVPSVVITEKKSFVFKLEAKDRSEKRKCTMKCVYGGIRESSVPDDPSSAVQYTACGNELSLSSAADLSKTTEVYRRITSSASRAGSVAPASIFPAQSTLCVANSTEMERGLWSFEVRVGVPTAPSTGSIFESSTAADVAATTISASVADPVSSSAEAVEVPVVDLSGYDMIGILHMGSMMEHIGLSRSSSLVPSVSHIKAGCFVCSDSKVRIISSSVGEDENYACVELNVEELGSWVAGDTIGCLLYFSDGTPRVNFSRNGTWLKSSIDLSALSSTTFYPSVCVRNGTTFKPYFDGKSEAGSSVDASQFKSLVSADETEPIRYPETSWSDRMNWGYRFYLRELHNLYVRVARDFEIVWSSDIAEAPKGEKRISIWKPINLRVDFGACCQIVTSSAAPPVGAIIVSRNQCKPPSSFVQVFSSASLKMTVWRPQPPDENYVALGDIVVSGISQSPPSLESVLCVPVWAAQKCNVGNRLFKSDKGGEKNSGQKLSFWGVENNLGSFVGSPSLNWSKPTETYKLNSEVYNIIHGEWLNESDALLQPSLTWTCNMTNFLLSNEKCCKKALQSSIFSTLASYVQVNTALTRIKVIPLLIRMIRMSCEYNVLLPIESLDAACKLILSHASTKTQQAKDDLSDDLMTLLDLVVEVAAAKIHGLRAVASIMSNSKPREYYVEGRIPEIAESKEESEIAVESKDASDTLSRSVSKAASAEWKFTESVFSSKTVDVSDFSSQIQWWDVNISAEEKKLHRLTPEVIDMEKMLMKKMSSMYRLRQVISFLDSLGSDSSLTERMYSLPFGMLMRAWYEHISLCAFEESSHPVQSRGPPIKKRIHLPCANSITVTFDSRCHLSRGQLTLSYGDPSKLKTSVYKKDTIWPKVLQIVGDYVDIEFIPNLDSDDGSADSSSGADWGWALVAMASGALYEATMTEVSVPDVSEFPSQKIGAADPMELPSITSKNIVEGESSSNPNEIAPKVVSAAAPPLASSLDKERSKLMLVTQLGSKIASGEVRAPRASQFDVIIDRPNSKKTDRNIVFAMLIKHKKNGVLQEEYVQVDGRQKHKFGIQGASATYEIYALDEESIPKADAPAAVTVATAAAEVPVASLNNAEAPPSELPPPPPIIDVSVIPSSTGDTTESAAVVNTSPVATTTEHSVAHIVEAMSAMNIMGYEEPPRSDRWGCQICTFLNDLSDDSCTMCGMPRGDGHEDGEAEPRDVVASVPTAAAWWCARCTFMNPLVSSSCDMCGAPRPGDETSAVAALDAALADALRAGGEHEDHDDEDEDHDDDDDHNDDENQEDEEEDQDEQDEDDDEDEDEEEEQDEEEGGDARAAETGAAPETVAPDDEDEEEEDEGLFSLFDETAAAPFRSAPSLMREPSAGFAELLLARTTSDSGTAVATGAILKKKEQKDVILITTVVTKIRSTAKMEVRLEQSIATKRWTPVEFMQRMHSNWSREQDHALLDFLDSMESSSTLTIKALMGKIPTITLPKKFMEYKKSGFSEFNMLEVQGRLLLICYFNQHIEELLPIINIRNLDPQSLGAKIRRMNRFIFMRLKQPMLEKAIELTAAPSGAGLPASLSLDNMKALASRDLGEIEPTNSNCIFVQAFKELNAKDPMIFRHVTSNDRVFAVDFKEERGIDAGGVFREGVTRIVEDVFSEHFNLLILCPNGVHQVHMNMDKYVPNPRHTSTLALQMYEFLGKMMGMSLRVKLYLPFEFPPIVWKLLVGEAPTFEDLMAIDSITCKFLDAVRNCELDDIVDQDLFSLKYGDKLRFVYTGSDGVERELVKGGKSISVTFDNRIEYCNMVIEARLSEFNKQVAAISRGMGEVVPLRALQLFSWSQLEMLVSGSPVFDIALWKRNTEASGVSKETLALFWKVIESMTPKEQAGFVRFAWGRSRLPTAEHFSTKMKLTNAGSASLPLAHTCFFSVEMPSYTTEAAMRHGLMTAIHFGAGGILMS